MVFACQKNSADCVERYQLDVGIAVGLGIKSNPLVDGDTIPQVILLDVAWYADSLYFDNGELGYRLLQTNDSGFEPYVRLDTERLYFNFWHPANILLPTGTTSPIPPDNEEILNKTSVSKNSIASRSWAVNIGGRYHMYFDNSELSISAESDLTSVHNGQKFELTYRYNWHGSEWQLSVRPSLIWKSANLVNYYYGISERDTIVKDQLYRVKGGFQPSLSILYTQRLDKNWQFISNFAIQRLHRSMRQSPLIDDQNLTSVFVGVGYRF